MYPAVVDIWPVFEDLVYSNGRPDVEVGDGGRRVEGRKDIGEFCL
eukprot:CAMPEP_0118647058 /NCGR_PEP_ID=MMETSP0785-20121206/8402_1 /TAXON_ID=91992 /ORGANISM="Bolidomonas pacifica, Strain CCMP 1866" /LENGTH=44 /DNA_ID= /DNA_START= /DNA_END= /DNA_ORIENTATION=